jgi:tRNA 2-selenouridine synthase
VSPFAARKIGAAYVSENIAGHLRTRFLDRRSTGDPLIVCWRGGQRSGSLTTSCGASAGMRSSSKAATRPIAGWSSTARRDSPPRLSLTGDLRRHRQRQEPHPAGHRARGEQILDLEELACHKGSVLGVLPNCRQPSQKMFESRLLISLAAVDPKRRVFVEAESRKIGSLQVPEALIETMRAGACLTIEASIDSRVDFLLRDYDYFLSDPDWLLTRLHALRNLQGSETILRWAEYTRNACWRELVRELLQLHYDPLYGRSQKQNYSGFTAADRHPRGTAARQGRQREAGQSRSHRAHDHPRRRTDGRAARRAAGNRQQVSDVPHPAIRSPDRQFTGRPQCAGNRRVSHAIPPATRQMSQRGAIRVRSLKTWRAICGKLMHCNNNPYGASPTRGDTPHVRTSLPHHTF